MPFSTRTVSIVVASVLALALIGGAFWFSSPLQSTRTANARDMKEILDAYAKKDTDADGLPDWQESLYATDPANPHSVNADVTDGEAVAEGLVKPRFESQTPPEDVDPGTLPGVAPAAKSLTEAFARQFLDQYLQSTGGQPMTDVEQQAFVSYLINDLSQQVAQLLVSKYTLSSISQSQGMDVMTYVDNVERMLTAYNIPPDGTSFLLLSQDLIEQGDTSARTGILRRATMYENMAKASLQIVVPPSMARTHLQMVRSFDTLARLMRAVANHENDPLLTPGALSLYVPSGMDSVTAMRAMVAAVRTHGSIGSTGTGSVLLHMIGEAP